MKIALFGSTDLTLSIASFLEKESYKLSAIITAPEIFKISYNSDGVKNERFIDMHSWGLERNIPVINYENIDKTINYLKDLEIDFSIFAGWYYMVPKKIREFFPKGCGGFHASLLPQLRGGAPLNWAILLDFKETGVSFFELSDGVDDGLLYAQEKFSIEETDYIDDLIRKSETSVLKILESTLPKIKLGEIKKFKQDGVLSYCGQRISADSQINWRQSADSILKLIRASSKPYAGAFSFLENEKVIIWSAEISRIRVHGNAGQIIIINGDIYVSCEYGSLILKRIQSNSDLYKSNHKRLHWYD